MLDQLRSLAPLLGPLASVIITIIKASSSNTTDKRLRENLRVLAELHEKVAPSQKASVEREMQEHLSDLSAELHYQRVRRLDWGTVGTIGLVNTLGAGVLLAAFFIGEQWAWGIGGVIASLLFLFSIVGLNQLYEVPPQDERLPARLHKSD